MKEMETCEGWMLWLLLLVVCCLLAAYLLVAGCWVFLCLSFLCCCVASVVVVCRSRWPKGETWRSIKFLRRYFPKSHVSISVGEEADRCNVANNCRCPVRRRSFGWTATATYGDGDGYARRRATGDDDRRPTIPPLFILDGTIESEAATSYCPIIISIT